MTRDETGKLAVLWRGDRQARADATPANNRFYRVFEELASVGIHAEPAVYAEEMTDEVRAQLLQVDGVLVWVDPLSGGRNRVALDALLRDVSNQGVWVSAHPDVTLKMGVKEVLYRTKQLGWGTDTQLYRTANAFHEEFPRRLRSDGPRVLKQNRGNGGQGVWKVEHATSTRGWCAHGLYTGSPSRQRAGDHGARGFHATLRGVFRPRRMHHRSAVPAAAAGRDDPLLHGRG